MRVAVRKSVRTDPVAVVASVSELVTLGAATAYVGVRGPGAGVRLWWLGGLALSTAKMGFYAPSVAGVESKSGAKEEPQ